MLQVQTLRNTAQLDFQIIVQQLESDFFTSVAQRVINLAKSSAMNGAFDRVAVERFRFWCKGKSHDSVPTRTKQEDRETASQYEIENLLRRR